MHAATSPYFLATAKTRLVKAHQRLSFKPPNTITHFPRSTPAVHARSIQLNTAHTSHPRLVLPFSCVQKRSTSPRTSGSGRSVFGTPHPQDHHHHYHRHRHRHQHGRQPLLLPHLTSLPRFKSDYPRRHRRPDWAVDLAGPAGAGSTPRLHVRLQLKPRKLIWSLSRQS